MTGPESGSGAARILVVDDIEANRDLLALRVRQEGHVVEAVESGPAALALLHERPCDVVFLDVMMPEMSGTDVLQTMKADPALAAIPVIMVSALDEQSTMARCLELGAEDYLPKPFSPVILRARLRSALARKRLHDAAQLYARGLERDLEIGRRIQQGFLPESLPKVPGVELSAHLASARQVSGDFYDAFHAGDEGALLLTVGDVCDKGVGAALFMALFRSLIRAAGDPLHGGAARIVGGRRSLVAQAMQSASGQEQLTRIAGFTNDYIARVHGSSNMFATVFLGLLDPATGALDYLNAGHEPGIIIGRDGRLQHLRGTGPALGLLPDMRFDTGTLLLEPGEALAVFTDGIVEGRNGDGEAFGTDRLAAALAGSCNAADDVRDRVLDALAAFTGGAETADDVTLLVARRTES